MAIPTKDEIDNLPAEELVEWLDALRVVIASKTNVRYLRKTLKRALYMQPLGVMPDDVLCK